MRNLHLPCIHDTIFPWHGITLFALHSIAYKAGAFYSTRWKGRGFFGGFFYHSWACGGTDGLLRLEHFIRLDLRLLGRRKLHWAWKAWLQRISPIFFLNRISLLRDLALEKVIAQPRLVLSYNLTEIHVGAACLPVCQAWLRSVVAVL